MPEDKKPKLTVNVSLETSTHRDDVNLSGERGTIKTNSEQAYMFEYDGAECPNFFEYLDSVGVDHHGLKTHEEYMEHWNNYEEFQRNFRSEHSYLVEKPFDKPLDYINIDNLKEVYKEGGIEKAYDYLVDYFKENASNPDVMNATIRRLLGGIEEHYDSEKNHGAVGDSQTEILQKILDAADGEDIKNLVCGPIHGFIAETLHDAGIESALISGRYCDNMHATLIYKQADGKYTFANYGTSMTVESPTVLDAVREVYKSGSSLKNSGYVCVYDDKRGTYTEYSLEDVAAYGNNIDKSVRNNKTIFDQTDYASNMQLNVRASENGTDRGLKTEFVLPFSNESKKNQLLVGAELKQNGDSTVFTESKSVGGTVEYNFDNIEKGNHFGISTIMSYTKGQTQGNIVEEDRYNNEFDAPSQEQRLFTLGIQTEYSSKSTVLENDRVKLDHSAGVSFVGSGVHSKSKNADTGTFNGDARFAIETGLQATTANGMDAYATGGILMEFDAVYSGIIPTLGAKTNAGISYTHNGQNTAYTIFSNGNGIFTESSTKYGVTGGAQINTNLSSGNQLYTVGQVSYENQNINVGGFQEHTRSSISPSLEAGLKMKNGTTFFTGAKYTKDFINSKRSNFYVKAGARINF